MTRDTQVWGLGGRLVRCAASTVLCLGLATLPVAAGAGRPAVPAVSARDEATLALGKVVLTTRRGADSDGTATITGLARISATHEKVWSILLSPERSKEAAASVKKIDVYGSTEAPDGTRVWLLAWHLKVAFSEIVYHTRREYHPHERYMRWSLDTSRPNGIRDTRGSYSTHDTGQPGQVLLLYESRIDTGKAIPQWLEEDLTQSSLKKYLQFVKRVAELG